MESMFLYGFFDGANSGGKFGSFCVVPKDFWDVHHTRMTKYMNDNDIVDIIEGLGFYEVMQNTFEYDATKFSRSKVETELNNLGYMVHSKEFEEYLNGRGGYSVEQS